tara:strand:- start:51 stop:671 length:621 start_codon:yes stop_codon:yes gene_type:complete
MIIWSDNRKFPENIHTELIGRIEKEYPDKKKFYSSYFEGMQGMHMQQHETYADLLLPYYGDIIVDIMRNLGMWKHSRYYFNVWTQRYNSENINTHEPHAHFTGNEIISFNHIIDASKNKCFYFIDDDGNKTYPGEQKSGDIFAWPSWLMHGVDHVEDSNVDRLIVAGNIMLESIECGHCNRNILECVDKRNPENHREGEFIWRYHT